MSDTMNIPDRDGGREIGRFFERAQLPAPLRGEYYWAKDGGRIVFLTPYGCVVRITPKDRKFTTSSPRFLKPLFNCAAGKFEIDIYPGIDCPVDPEEADFLWKQILQKDGIKCEDPHNFNFGFIPGTNRTHGVMLDHDKTRITALAALRLSNEPDPQDVIYAALRAAMQKAWNSDTPSPAAIADVWKLCAEMKAQGLLLSPWEDSQNDYHGTVFAARHYSQKLALRKT